MSESAHQALSLLLNPLVLADFMHRYWEREVLHIERNDGEYFSGILQLAQIEQLLSSQELHFPEVQLSRRHAPVDAEAYTDNGKRIVTQRLVEEHRRGATIVMSGAHQLIPTLADFRRGVQSALGLRCQTNLYLSPPAEQGFGAHYDSHDVFILQVEGRKTFNFYQGGVDRPYSHEGFDASVHTPGELAESIKLGPGDTLYIPRGVFHDAVACEQASLHITLGVYAVTLRDALLEMVEVMTDEEARYRRSVPPDLWMPRLVSQSQESATQRFEAMESLLACTLEEHHWQAARTRLLNGISLDNARDCTGLLAVAPAELQPDTLIRMKFAEMVSCERQGRHVCCRLPGQVLELEDPLALAFEQLLERREQSICAWDFLDTDQQLALAEQFLQAGLIEVLDVTERTDNGH